MWFDEVVKVKERVRGFFLDHFNVEARDSFRLGDIPGASLSVVDARHLERLFEADEIKSAVWNCGVEKSPGPDGFSFHFYRFFWELVKHDVERFVFEFHSFSKLAKGLNSAFITVIPNT